MAAESPLRSSLATPAGVDLVDFDEVRGFVFAVAGAPVLVPPSKWLPEAFADSAQRSRWIQERGMTVFNLYDPNDPLRSVDLFVEPPIPLDELWSRSHLIHLPAADIRVASIEDLIAMKKVAGRPQDSADIEALEALLDERRERPGELRLAGNLESGPGCPSPRYGQGYARSAPAVA